jgi:hypothetical protein
MGLSIIDQGPACPRSTQDIGENLRNRKRAVQVAHYGPANPGLENLPYWRDRAANFGTSVEQARTMRCGNCAFFDVRPEMLECIARGIGVHGTDPYDAIVQGSLGYCRAFDFKCAASRTCDAWVAGGPIA